MNSYLKMLTPSIKLIKYLVASDTLNTCKVRIGDYTGGASSLGPQNGRGNWKRLRDRSE